MDSLGDIQTYRVQLEQVEAALVTESENEELIKLRADLLDIIALTEDLMGLSSSKKSKPAREEVKDRSNKTEKPSTMSFPSLYDDEDDVAPSNDPTKEPSPERTDTKVTLPDNLVIGKREATAKVAIIDEKERLYRQQLQELKMLTVEWKPGEKCQALNSDTNQYNEAEVLCKGDGFLQIKFADTGDISNVLLANVRKLKKRRWGEVTQAPNPADVKKAVVDKEKRKKKKLSRKQRQNEMESAKEKEKTDWQSFMTKNKTVKKAQGKKSIFASPDNFDGKIGIGTCGISGKGMTSFAGPDKWKR